jgi:adenosylcobinamide-GDP ribazoletransferase
VPLAAGRVKRTWRGCAGAITFLTIVPVPLGEDVGLAGAVGWFPLVGAAVGALAGGVRLAVEPLVGRTVGTVLALIALVIATGALHQDGLADTADGLGVRGDPTRRLAVMGDSSIGAFGALALIGWALVMLTTLSSLSGTRALRTLVTACAAARWATLLHGAGAPPARAGGLGAAFQVGGVQLGVATVFSVAVAIPVCGPGAGALAIAAAIVVAALSLVFVRRSVGGRTGDTLGATVAIAEAAVCVTLLAAWRG